MCVEVKIDGRYVRTVGELAAAVGPGNVVYGDERAAAASEAACLCGVDLGLTAANVGRRAVWVAAVNAMAFLR
ncbi:MAG TPA: hypothetical protein VEH84_17160 [Alphaproteobacteria bacterium]|nr:hypothetical protein [Alphaproteobacteria bacterium]